MDPHACGCRRCAALRGGAFASCGGPKTLMDPHAFSAVAAVLCAALLCVSFVAAAIAQTPSHLSDAEPAPPSRWSGDAARLDEQIRLRVLSADDPHSHWIAGQFDSTDIASKVRNYATARVAAPQERLYLASLAMACLQPVQPTLPECDAVDRLADWATRDADNGLPTMLLAARASKRGDNDGTIAYLELAAAKPRFDEYASRGGLEFWDYVMAFPADGDRAAKTTLAIGYAAFPPETTLSLVSVACGAAGVAAETRRVACSKAGAAMAERSTTGTTRMTGAGIAERNAVDERSAERIRASRATLQAMLARCGDDERTKLAGLESADAPLRTRTIDGLDRIVRDRAQLGQIAECERRLSTPAR